MHRRITLVNSAERTFWNAGADTRSRIVFAASLKILRYALDGAIRDFEEDLERVIIDRTATPGDFLDILASLPEKFTGDVVYANGQEPGYLSAVGRGGGRVLYALNADDLGFYLETQGLVAVRSVAAA
jgi:hypothetical protein